jgi:hypothetical protein
LPQSHLQSAAACRGPVFFWSVFFFDSKALLIFLSTSTFVGGFVRIKTSLALALAGAVSFSAAFATTLTEMTLEQMTAEAEVAIVGKVTATRTVQTDNGIATVTTFTVESNAWGADGTTVDVVTPGGSFKSSRFQLGDGTPNTPFLAKDQRSVLLLSRDSVSGELTIVGFNQGNLQIVKTAQGNKVTLPGTDQLMPLDSAMAEIKRAKVAPTNSALAR